MERIKQALERARAERDAVAGGNAAAAQSSDAGREAPRIRRMTRPASAALNIVYTQTTKIAVDPERLRERRIVAMSDSEPAANAYKVLRTHVLQRMRVKGWRTLAVTSVGEAEGKTVTAINLALSLAGDVNQTVLLVDLDLRRPSIGRFFSGDPLPGISDYLTDDRPIAELLINPGVDRFVILPGNHSFTHSSEMLSSPKMVGLIEELKGRYADRLVLLDMPPVLAGDDVIAFSPHVDAVMLVVEEGKTTKQDLAEACALLDEAKIIGTLLNKAEQAAVGVGYY